MSTLNTSNQQIPYPDHNEFIKFAWSQLRDAILATEPKLNMKFTSAADLATRVPAPTSGMVAWLDDSKTLNVYHDAAWHRIYPPAPAVYTGTVTPASSLGAVGDLYVQY
jgi:hypothetical protein